MKEEAAHEDVFTEKTSQMNLDLDIDVLITPAMLEQ